MTSNFIVKNILFNIHADVQSSLNSGGNQNRSREARLMHRLSTPRRLSTYHLIILHKNVLRKEKDYKKEIHEERSSTA